MDRSHLYSFIKYPEIPGFGVCISIIIHKTKSCFSIDICIDDIYDSAENHGTMFEKKYYIYAAHIKKSNRTALFHTQLDRLTVNIEM